MRLRYAPFVALAMVIAVAACGSQPAPVTPTPTPTPNPAAPATSTVSPAAGGDGAKSATPAAPATSGATAGGYTYCKQICQTLGSCKDVTFGDVGCEAGCKQDMNTTPTEAIAHFQCVLAHKSCAEYTPCFADDNDRLWPTDESRITACRKYCGIVQGTCKGKFADPPPYSATAGSTPVPAPTNDCIRGCADNTQNNPSGNANLANVFCTNVSVSCGEALACASILESYDNREAQRPAPTPHAPSPSPTTPGKAACADLGEACRSDGQCCGRAAQVRCWSGHCKAR